MDHWRDLLLILQPNSPTSEFCKRRVSRGFCCQQVRSTSYCSLIKVLTTFSYRVSIIGFPDSHALAANDSLNLDLLDQRLRLKWIQENIHLFGGNPDNVTIFGESAGALSTGLQLLAYGGKKSPPFQRITTESGAQTSIIGLRTTSSAVHTSALASLVGCTSSSSQEQLSCSRSVPLDTLNNSLSLTTTK